MPTLEFDRCDAVIADDGTIEYYAHVTPEESGYWDATAYFYLDGELAAVDGPMQVNSSGITLFEQPRGEYDTKEGEHIIQDVRDAGGRFGYQVEVDFSVEFDMVEI